MPIWLMAGDVTTCCGAAVFELRYSDASRAEGIPSL
jgi:hypothetical protein